jgi:hypothetical protein
VAAQIVLPSFDARHNSGFEIWVTCSYAPTNTTATEIKSFYQNLSSIINHHMADALQYHLGDWNGCLRPTEDQLKIPFAPLNVHEGDRSVQDFFHRQKLLYPIDWMAPAFEIGETFSHKTTYIETVSDQLITYLQVIDYIFVSSPRGIIDYDIDIYGDLTTNHISTPAGPLSDHAAISMTVDLDILCRGRLLGKTEEFKPIRFQLPKKNSVKPQDVEGRKKTPAAHERHPSDGTRRPEGHF